MKRLNMRLAWSILVAVGLMTDFNMLEAAPIPYPSALDAAAVQQNRLDEIHRRALPLGNGDLNALLCDRDGVRCLRLTKNDN